MKRGEWRSRLARVALMGVVLLPEGTPGGVAALAAGIPDCNGNGIPDVQEVVPKFQALVLDAVADGAVSVSGADLDGDGDLDVLAALEDDDAIVWYENLGGRSFGPRRLLDGEASGASRVLAADLDGDGDLDVLSAARQYYTFVAWVENLDGAGQFSAPKPIEVESPLVGACGLAAADVDGNGDVEPAVSSMVTNQIDWYSNAGGAAVFTPRHLAAGLSEPRNVFLGDVSGDLRADLLTVSMLEGTVLYYRNLDGQGTFQLAETIDGGLGVPRTVLGSDLDGDGDSDALVASYGTGQVTWYRNVGGVFGPRLLVSMAAPGAQVALGTDLDGDGDRDVVVAAATGSTGPGPDSTCCGPGSCSDAECKQRICSSVDGFCCEVQWDQVCADEALADPDCSVACGGGTGRFVWHENVNGQGSFGPAKLIAASEGAWDVFAGDFDGDGKVDLLTASRVEDQVAVRWNLTLDCNGNDLPDECDIAAGTERDADCDGVPDSCDPDDGAGTDCTGNGVPDRCDVQSGASDCTGNGVPDVCEPDCDGDGVADVCEVGAGAADTNGNGVPDVCDPDCNGNDVPDDLDIVSGSSVDCDQDQVPDECEADCDTNGVVDGCDTSVVFASHTIKQQGSSMLGPLDVLTGDVDGDGDRDVVAALGESDSIVLYRNLNGAGTAWSEQVVVATDEPRALALADMDGDADLDLFAIAGDDQALSWYENAPTGWVGHPVSSPNYAQYDVAVGDLDGDGDVDAFSLARLFRNLDGKGTLWSTELVVQYAGTSVDAADLDGDGDLDLVADNSDVLTWHENLGGASYVSHVLPAPLYDDVIYAVAAADLDNDGDPDILAGAYSTIAWYENLDGAGGFDYPEILAADSVVTSVSAADLDADGDRDIVYVREGLGTKARWIENLGPGWFGPPADLPPGPMQEGVVTTGDLDGDGDQDAVSLFDLGSTLSVRWFENGSDDCNGNGSPDSCEADCDADGLIDVCALAGGGAVDCNANQVPDDCDTQCSGTCDIDGDQCEDALDEAPADPQACADTDGDLCDDCAGGSFAPGADGPDTDGDGYCATGDCADSTAAVWASPSEARGLVLAKGPGAMLLSWSAPVAPGAQSVAYDVLRSPSPSDFFTGTLCIESEGGDLVAADAGADPAPGQIWSYLVRARNACPGSSGNLGSASDGTPRTGVVCP